MNRVQVACPGCAKMLRSANHIGLRDVLARHIRNCVPMRKAAAISLEARTHRRRAALALVGLALLVAGVLWLVLRGGFAA